MRTCNRIALILRTMFYQTFVQQNMSDKTWVLDVLTLADQQMLYNNVGMFSPGFSRMFEIIRL